MKKQKIFTKITKSHKYAAVFTLNTISMIAQGIDYALFMTKKYKPSHAFMKRLQQVDNSQEAKIYRQMLDQDAKDFERWLGKYIYLEK